MSQDEDGIRLLSRNEPGLRALLAFIDKRISDLDNKFTQLAKASIIRPERDSEEKTAAVHCYGQITGLRELRDDLAHLVTRGITND